MPRRPFAANLLRPRWLMPALAAFALGGCGSQPSAVGPASPAAGQSAEASSQAASAGPAPAYGSEPTATAKPLLRSPLTGLPVAAPEDVRRRPIVVKLGNSEAERPQSGLSQADVVYESVTEGGITRYAAVFQSQDATTIGPVRSARLSDLQIAPEFDAVLAHVGASGPIMTMLRSGKVADLDQFFFHQYYHRTTNRVAPYNVYTSTATLRAGAADRGFAATAQVAPFAFEDDAPPSSGAEVVDFDFAKETHVEYLYEPAQHAYRQIEYGAPTKDAVTGKPVPIANLVLQFAPVQATDIVEDHNGSRSLEYDLVGSGKAMVFHDGTETDGTWRRVGLNDRTSFLDAAGKLIAFARGSVWIAIVKPGTPVTVMPLAA